MRENEDQNNSEYGHFSRSGGLMYFQKDFVMDNLPMSKVVVLVLGVTNESISFKTEDFSR